MQKYISKPIKVQAIQFNGNSNRDAVEDFIGRKGSAEIESDSAYIAGIAPPIFSLHILTEKGMVAVCKGDWIVKEIDGNKNEFSIVENEMFIRCYDLLM